MCKIAGRLIARACVSFRFAEKHAAIAIKSFTVCAQNALCTKNDAGLKPKSERQCQKVRCLCPPSLAASRCHSADDDAALIEPHSGDCGRINKSIKVFVFTNICISLKRQLERCCVCENWAAYKQTCERNFFFTSISRRSINSSTRRRPLDARRPSRTPIACGPWRFLRICLLISGVGLRAAGCNFWLTARACADLLTTCILTRFFTARLKALKFN